MVSWLRSALPMPLPERAPAAPHCAPADDALDKVPASGANSSSGHAAAFSTPWRTVPAGKGDVLVHYHGVFDSTARQFCDDAAAAASRDDGKSTTPSVSVMREPRTCAVRDLPSWTPADKTRFQHATRTAPLRVVVISDTHEFHGAMLLPPGDVLIHCGDVLNNDKYTPGFASNYNIRHFFRWFNAQPFALRVVIGGNHDAQFQKLGKDAVRRMAAPAVYLEDELLDVCGLRIYGSPRSTANSSSSPNTSFQQATRERWATRPGLDALQLVWHTPGLVLAGCATSQLEAEAAVAQTPRGDLVHHGARWTLRRVDRVTLPDPDRIDILCTHGAWSDRTIQQAMAGFNPALHCCGHVHELHGVGVVDVPAVDYNGSGTMQPTPRAVVSVNGASLRGHPLRERLQPPIVVDFA